MNSRGQLSSLATGRRGTHTTSVETLGKIAELLAVSFEWLALGTGPKDAERPTEREAGEQFARGMGAREDAIAAARDRHRDHETSMDRMAWLSAIKLEMEALERARIPRPEVVHVERARVERVKRKKAKLTKEAAARGAESNEGGHDQNNEYRHRHRAG